MWNVVAWSACLLTLFDLSGAQVMLAVLFLFDEGVLNQEKFQLQTFEDWFRVVLDPKLKDQKISLGYCMKGGLTIL